MYRIFLLFLLVTYFFSSFVGAYFEDAFFCTVEKNTISVSIYTGDKNCFSYMHQISSALEEVDSDIQQAESYITKRRDILYWKGVQIDLSQKKHDLENLRKQFDVTMSDYEQELFVQVKGIVGYYLMPQTQVVVEKLAKADILLKRLRYIGDSENYPFVVQQIELLQQQLILLDRIRFAYSFAELIPPLKIYIKGEGFDYEKPLQPIL